MATTTSEQAEYGEPGMPVVVTVTLTTTTTTHQEEEEVVSDNSAGGVSNPIVTEPDDDDSVTRQLEKLKVFIRDKAVRENPFMLEYEDEASRTRCAVPLWGYKGDCGQHGLYGSWDPSIPYVAAKRYLRNHGVELIATPGSVHAQVVSASRLFEGAGPF